jgi:hypothetical protein
VRLPGRFDQLAGTDGALPGGHRGGGAGAGQRGGGQGGGREEEEGGGGVRTLGHGNEDATLFNKVLEIKHQGPGFKNIIYIEQNDHYLEVMSRYGT